jgi:hypothetical protein
MIAPSFEIGLAKSQTIGGMAFILALVEKKFPFTLLILKRFKLLGKSFLLPKLLNIDTDLDEFCSLNKRINKAFGDLSVGLNKLIRFPKRVAIVQMK